MIQFDVFRCVFLATSATQQSSSWRLSNLTLTGCLISSISLNTKMTGRHSQPSTRLEIMIRMEVITECTAVLVVREGNQVNSSPANILVRSVKKTSRDCMTSIWLILRCLVIFRN